MTNSTDFAESKGHDLFFLLDRASMMKEGRLDGK